ncbi:hypothetical protein KBD33_05160 [Candidatus Gracilibacteria bacterium]|nr:hypothetical protein [Candidatus Gracilibacteria bacterium]
MNPDITNIDTATLDSTLMGVNMDPTHLLWSTVLTLVLSHIGANYLKDRTPRGYLFWFTILNLIIGFMLM